MLDAPIRKLTIRRKERWFEIGGRGRLRPDEGKVGRFLSLLMTGGKFGVFCRER